MSHLNNEKTTDKASGTPPAFCADFLGDLDTSTDAVRSGCVEKTGCRVARQCSS